MKDIDREKIRYMEKALKKVIESSRGDVSAAKRRTMMVASADEGVLDGAGEAIRAEIADRVAEMMLPDLNRIANENPDIASDLDVIMKMYGSQVDVNQLYKDVADEYLAELKRSRE